MEKFGKFLLFLVNLGINLFLLSIVVLVLAWLIWDIPPNVSAKKTATWIEQTGRSLLRSDVPKKRAGEN